MRAAFYTLGCKVNQYETAALAQQFSAAGFDIVEPDEDAEVYIVNSCTVTAEGDRKSRQALRRFRRTNPSAVIALTGCFPQAFPNAAERIPEADIITGSRNRSDLLAAVEQCLAGGERIINIVPHEKGEHFEAMRADKTARTRAFVKIEDGCNCRCAYCIIPTARGPVRSKPLNDLREELSSLAAVGYREVVLAGINLPSYGRDLGLRLLDALKTACAVPGIDRIRLGSLEPDLLTPKDVAEMATLPGLCPQFHLSLQSGCDATLKRMRRRYTAAEFRAVADQLREVFPGCSLTTDVMVGFPGETEEEFAASMDFVYEIGFAKAHVFAYSQRPGTVAATMPDQVSSTVKRERAKRMAQTAENCRKEFLQAQIGTQAVMLAEQLVSPGCWEGYTENYTPVLLHCEDDLSGQLIPIRITDLQNGYCTAETCHNA